jgi:hypothetical protein
MRFLRNLDDTVSLSELAEAASLEGWSTGILDCWEIRSN